MPLWAIRRMDDLRIASERVWLSMEEKVSRRDCGVRDDTMGL